MKGGGGDGNREKNELEMMESAEKQKQEEAKRPTLCIDFRHSDDYRKREGKRAAEKRRRERRNERKKKKPWGLKPGGFISSFLHLRHKCLYSPLILLNP